MRNHIVVIEDEKQIAQFIADSLAVEGFDVYTAQSGKVGLIECGTRKPDLVILDLGLPDIDGVEVIGKLRGWSAIPIIVLSARSMEASKVAALDAGADDYLTKPFSVAELLARVRAHLRRYLIAPDRPDGMIRFGDVEVNLEARRILKAGQEVRLTPIEFRLLTALVRHAGKVVTHRQLLGEVWGPNHTEHGHYLRIYMGHLRQKLEDDPAQPHYILTEVGIGYRFIRD
ncbi:two-component system response regulator KdpE [Chitinivorax sp. B]|uniref:two-component system response regulator KdpE n=1 Tax=Chitinivorax sp. B TaxID=2502235 RepID=UPI0010F5595B|nr:two-component system response regulator KdpE [Chitinivorax sp. B]